MRFIVARSKGQRSIEPSSRWYQELQPGFQTVGPSAAATCALNSSVASSVGSTGGAS